jgi:hypothetical protein
MATILQCNPPVHGYSVYFGECFVKFVIDYGPDVNPIFVIDIFENRQCRSIDSNEFYFGENGTYDLQKPEVPTERQI